MLLNYQEVFRHNILIARSCEQVEIGAMSTKQSHGTTPSLSFWFTVPFGHMILNYLPLPQLPISVPLISQKLLPYHHLQVFLAL